MSQQTLLRVAVPVPMHADFDYLWQPDLATTATTVPVAGSRVQVSFGRRQLVGVVMGRTPTQDISSDIDYKPIQHLFDSESLWPQPLWELLLWASDYYLHPLGDVISNALPVLLRQGEPADYQTTREYRLTALGEQQDLAELKRAPQQQRVLAALKRGPMLRREFIDNDLRDSAVQALQTKGLISQAEVSAKPSRDWHINIAEQPLQLNAEQAIAVATIAGSDKATPFLLHGVTGSGKTEVYLQVMTEVLRKGRQVLVLVPEIGLTPQTLRRFQRRFAVPIVMLHSGLNDRERLDAWLDAKHGSAAIIIGTRSAIFTPCDDLGLIILDEEHDASYKQQEGFRYSARDLAVKRGQLEHIPVLLGSATPSLETLHNADQDKYGYVQLKQRAGGAKAVRHVLLDIKQQPLQAGLSAELIKLMKAELEAGQQVLLFLNRRGFAPAVLCHECGWIAQCRRCDANLTLHQSLGQVHCHHCGYQTRVPHQCHDCGSTQLMGHGVGTEQLETTLKDLFPEHPVLRIDRDSTRRKGELAKHLQAATENRYPLLIGTQMLAKGHHFPEVTLVALLDVDGALFSSDFRAPERLGQLYTQVAGRAGRASKAGQVVLQTHHPEHELVQDLVNNGYDHFARTALHERRLTQLPPFSQLALFRAEASQREAAEQALSDIAKLIPEVVGVQVVGPMPAAMERRAGRYRYQLLLQCAERGLRQQLLRHLQPQIQRLKLNQVRWSLDIDPQDFT